MIRIKKGLDLPIVGAPEQKIYDAPPVKHVALTGPDFNSMKPSMLVQVGDQVKQGQKLFEDKKNPGVFFTAPVSGKVTAIERGEKRVFQTLVIEKQGEDKIDFGKSEASQLQTLSRDKVVEKLIESGEWTAFRTRPFNKSPQIDSKPVSIFVNLMNTNPLAPSTQTILEGQEEHLKNGLTILKTLTDGKVFVCKSPELKLSVNADDQITIKEFSGIHPAGNVGTHIHFLSPVSMSKIVWHIDFQDLINVAKLFTTGHTHSEKVVALCGPSVKNPRLVKTNWGADLSEIVKDQLSAGENRVISGSVFYGRNLQGAFHFLGRFASQITALKEGREREFLGWHAPGLDKFSISRVFLSAFTPKRKFGFNTSMQGSHRAMVPIGLYEDVMPLDILPTQLLRSLVCRDTDSAQQLGCLELAEEDLALCTYVDTGKVDYGPILKENLEIIEKEG